MGGEKEEGSALAISICVNYDQQHHALLDMCTKHLLNSVLLGSTYVFLGKYCIYESPAAHTGRLSSVLGRAAAGSCTCDQSTGVYTSSTTSTSHLSRLTT